MKKQLLIISIVFSSGADLLAGPATWKQSVQTRLARAQQTVSSYYDTLRINAACLREGTCPELRAKLAQQAIAAGKALAVIAAIAGTGAALYYADSPETSSDYVPTKLTINRPQDILKKYGIQLGLDDSPPTLFITAVINNAVPAVKKLVGLVEKNILLAGHDIAKAQRLNRENAQIRGIIEAEIDRFNPSILAKRNQFIRNALGGLDAEIQATICSVSPETVQEAYEQVSRQKPFYTEVLQVLKTGCQRY